MTTTIKPPLASDLLTIELFFELPHKLADAFIEPSEAGGVSATHEGFTHTPGLGVCEGDYVLWRDGVPLALVKLDRIEVEFGGIGVRCWLANDCDENVKITAALALYADASCDHIQTTHSTADLMAYLEGRRSLVGEFHNGEAYSYGRSR